MLATRTDIEKYIPQRAPMVMIHSLLKADEVQAITQLQVEKDNIFIADGKLAEPGLVENIAQTAAAQIGYVCQQQSKPVPIGYIAAIKDLLVHDLPAIGTEIRTTIEVINMIMDITLIRGTVYLGETVLCECEMRIFVKL
jgi:3-hydroxyacyl-[acyl-carrier-protein] dehydratase